MSAERVGAPFSQLPMDNDLTARWVGITFFRDLMMTRNYPVAVIGRTGKGNYGAAVLRVPINVVGKDESRDNSSRSYPVTESQLWIKGLQLRRHPEGGWFRETYRSEEVLAEAALPPRFGGNRAFSTAIYFLLDSEDFSALHRIKQDEVWHFYDGSSVTIHVIDQEGNYTTIQLGRDVQAGEVPQTVVKAGCLFGATVNDTRSYALAGCTVAPGFDFADFEMPAREELCRLYPRHRQVIERLTRYPR